MAIAAMMTKAASMTRSSQMLDICVNVAAVCIAKETPETQNRIGIAVWVFLPISAMDTILPINICAIYSPICSTAVVERCHAADWLWNAKPTAVKKCQTPCEKGLKIQD